MKKHLLFPAAFGIFLFLFAGCGGPGEKSANSATDTKKLSLMKEKFGTVDGKEVDLYTLKNKNGLTVKITNYGAIITSILAPDKNGTMGDIVLGYDSLKGYLTATPYFGCIAGRFANRIAKGEFTLDGKKYNLARNNGNNALHGGIKGFDKVVWDAVEKSDSTETGIVLTYLSKDGEEGYPGNLTVHVNYALNDSNELFIRITATTDKATPVNLCNHTYFNLSGGKSDVLGHTLQIFADRYTPVNDELIPTGKLPEVKGTPMDFLTLHAIGERIAQVKGGYDHNFVLNHPAGEMGPVAILTDPVSGRQVEIKSTQPGVQFYSGNFLDGTITGKNNINYKVHYGLCLETQHFPDSPNQPSFPNTILRPGETFSQNTVFRFSVSH
jgi:aldose 1-epimerase